MPWSTYQLEYGRHVVEHHCCCWLHGHAINTASHVDHQKRSAWFSIPTYMHACGPVPIAMSSTI